jgi:hypothetical protein
MHIHSILLVYIQLEKLLMARALEILEPNSR